MFKSMRMKAKTGMEARIGKEALVIEDIDPEGKIELKEEIWTATARGKKIPQGTKVRIRGARGLVLIVESLDEEEKREGGLSGGST
jgi:membrane-bound ClpP family serine protease